jgi:alpha-D-xyloside xylohydrolase
MLSATLSRMPLLVRAGSIVPLGPVQHAGQDRRRIELRSIRGPCRLHALRMRRHYNYENGARATISIGWDDVRRTLVIGERNGSFPGMINARRITVHLAGSSARNDRQIDYRGERVTVTLE